MNSRIGRPYFQMSPATTKNRVLLPTMEAARNSQKSNLKTPDAMVNTL